ncbi:MAG: hypothetical protein ACI9JN_000698 [Bacteroidia bacterium]|jgi:hypothetical protein
MKSNAKFFTGLGLGLLVSFLFLNVGMLKSESPASADASEAVLASLEENETNGMNVPALDANALIDAYKAYTTAPGSKSLTEGGVIDRRELKAILGSSSDDLIKFRFYLKTEGETQNIGIVFYPKRTSSTLLRTGYQSYCPNMCN